MNHYSMHGRRHVRLRGWLGHQRHCRSVAQAAASGGALVHGAHVCACGYEGKLDAYHWLTQCPHGPSPEVPRLPPPSASSAQISSSLHPVRATVGAGRRGAGRGERSRRRDARVASEALGKAIEEARAVDLPDTHVKPVAARYQQLRTLVPPGGRRAPPLHHQPWRQTPHPSLWRPY